MIEFTKAYKTSNAATWPTLELAQQHELKILALKIHLIDILTMTPTSEPEARSVNGGTKKRRTKAEIQAAATLAALQDAS